MRKNKVVSFLSRNRSALITVAVATGSIAFAQTSPVTDLGLDTFVTGATTAISDGIKASAPKLVVLLGLVGAFYFVWNRIRSLW